MVIIPKGGGADFHGNGLVKVLWKAISGIINCRLLSAIHFHDVLRSFCARRVTGISTLDSKLLRQLIATSDTVLNSIFLYLSKAYDDLDR